MIFPTPRRLIGLALAAALLPINAQAQTVVFPDLASHIKLGDLVSLTDSDGKRVEGKVTDLTVSSLTLLLDGSGTKSVFREATVSRIVIKDSRRNGALIGLAAGAIPGVILGFGFKEYCYNEASSCPAAPFGMGAVFGGIGAAIGAGIDGLIHKSIRVARRPGATLNLSPIVAPNTQGIRVSIRF
jgi:hypothetical protein